MERSVIREIPAAFKSPGLRFTIAPYTLFDGNRVIPVKFAEAFGFGRAKIIFFWSTGTSNLVLSSPDGESGRPVGKAECLGDPKG